MRGLLLGRNWVFLSSFAKSKVRTQVFGIGRIQSSEKRAMAESNEEECMIVQVTPPAINWNQSKRPKIEVGEQPDNQLAMPSSSTTPTSGATQLDSNVMVKEEMLEYYPTMRPNVDQASIARLLANQLAE